jgi:hypothetical protein
MCTLYCTCHTGPRKAYSVNVKKEMNNTKSQFISDSKAKDGKENHWITCVTFVTLHVIYRTYIFYTIRGVNT